MDLAQTSQPIHLPAHEVLDVNGIERELNDLWTAMAGQDHDEDGGLMRARVLNLLVHVDSEAELKNVCGMISDITAAHPCRAIVMMGDAAGADEDIEVFVSLQCRPSAAATDRQLRCEQVTLEAHGRFAVELPSAATPLIIPDLPSILWWKGDVEFDDPVFRNLSRAVDRVVFDSANFNEVHHDLLGFVDFIDRQRATDARLSDLNWTRHAAWRSLIAAFFDAPENRAQLDRIDRVTIDCARPATTSDEAPPQGLVLAGWLASCLDWKIGPDSKLNRKADSWRIEISEGDQKIQIEWRLVDHASSTSCEIVRVELACDAAAEPVHFSIELSEDGKYLGTAATGEDVIHAPRVLNCPNQDTAHLLTAELNAGGQDLLLERSVRAAAEMVKTAATAAG
jgi:glucose-6-phosphate dehydrogenase assembly protein OpcA